MTMFGSQWLANAGSGYEISQSIRFNDDDSPKLSRTPSAGNRTTWTYSVWLKRGDIPGLSKDIFSASTDSTNRFEIQFNASEQIRISQSDSGSTTDDLQTNRLFRDPSAWYHIVVRYDTTESTASDRIKLYVNGVQETSFSTANYPTASYEGDVNANVVHTISSRESGGVFFDGYMAEINFVSGTAKAASDFGETNDDGVWIPKRYSGAYGTNGFYLTGANSSDFGEDFSGNNNDWTASGLAAADQVSDSPTSNWCTMNSLAFDSSQITLSDGNLTLAWNTPNGDGGTTALSTFDLSQHGKSYWEFSAANSSVNYSVGICTNTSLWRKPRTQSTYNVIRYGVQDASTASMQVTSGDGSIDSTGVLAITGSEVGMMAFDPASGKLWVGQDGTFFNSGDPAAGSDEQGTFTGGNNTGLYVNVEDFSSAEVGAVTFNFGQSGFAHTPPTGFTALNTANLPEPSIKDGSEYFHNQLYTGNGSSGHAITNDANAGDFQPDFLWLAPRSNGDNHVMWDVARGTTSRIYSNKADPADVDGTAQLTFEADGFDLDTTDVNFNGSGRTYVAWQWKTQGAAGSSNTDGSINTTTTSVNQTAGFSINTYTGTGSNATVGHGLGAVPKMILIKDTTNSESWIVYHEGVGNDGNLYLNLTNAKATQAVFQDTTPTSSVFSLGTTDGANKASGVHVAYCFAEVPGYSSFGSYTGNGSAGGPFVNCGFKPSWLMIKRSSGGTGNWDIFDNKRDPFNVMDAVLDADNTTAETTYSTIKLDFLSNGFKVRGTQSNINNSGDTYIYMAFAEHPFGGDDAAPATAR